MSNSDVGEILDPRGKTHIEWKIPNYFSLSQKADSYFESPKFHFFNAKWCIKIYTNGCRKNSSVGWIDFYLFVICPVSSYSLTFKLGIKGLEKEICECPIFYTFCENKPGYGWIKVCKTNDLIRLMRKHSPKDTLVIYCDATAEVSVQDTESQTSIDNTATLCRDFQDLLQSGRESDVTIDVCGHVFKVHKLILKSRSPVFAAMFDHNMRENTDRIIKISDCDPNAFQDFLQYVYTGKLEKILWDNAINLFTIADKYCMTELCEKCAKIMAEGLSVDNAYDVLVIADRHNENGLKESAKKLLTDKMATIKTTDKWKTFVAQNPLLAVEIIMKFVPDE